ncbi:MAG: hypothetical protein KatS3mg124_2480 [Porticoccaceae bacterium]|nr:MAG: hypothetical protein KatS3mg124_2480 [Porticoccaceae bacterium]
MSSRALIEAVVAPDSNLAGKTVKESLFRTQFGGAILAVSRDGRKIDMKVGDIVLRPGDTLLIEAPADFVRRHRYHRDFLLLSQLDGATLPDHGKAPVALAALALFVLAVVSGLLPLVTASVLLVAGLGLFRCINLDLAQRSVDARVVLAIGASLALGYALQKTGLASAMAGVIAALGGESPWLNLVLLYLFTVAATELVTNNAAVVLAYPVAVSLAERLEVSLLPFALAIMFAASMSFMTPFGYQTNLMVQGPGGYHGRDYLRVGGPFSLLAAVVVLALVPIFWPFHP